MNNQNIYHNKWILNRIIKNSIFLTFKNQEDIYKILTLTPDKIDESKESNKIILDKCKKAIIKSLDHEDTTITYKKILYKNIKELLERYDDTLESLSSISIYNENEVWKLMTSNQISQLESRDIQSSEDIIKMIKNENSIIKEQKDFLNKKHDPDRESFFDIIFEDIHQEIISINKDTKNKLEILILEQIKKDIEYYLSYYLSWLQNINTQKKKDRFKNALIYTELKFSWRNELELKNEAEELWLPKWWISFFWPIIDELLIPKESYISKKWIYINKVYNQKENIMNIEKKELVLFQEYCEAIINENYRSEYKLGKDILRELWEWEIPLQ